MYVGHMDTPLVWQNMLSLCCVCTGSTQTSSKHMVCIQTYGGCPSIEGHPNIVGHPNIQGDIWEHPNIQGAIQTYGGIQMYGTYGHSLSLTKHAFFVLSSYRGIQTWGHTIFCIILNHISHLVFSFNFKYFIYYLKYSFVLHYVYS